MRNFTVFLVFLTILGAYAHLHSHDEHEHSGFGQMRPHFKESSEEEEHHHDDHEHEHEHQHDHDHHQENVKKHRKIERLSTLKTWVYSLSAVFGISVAPCALLFFIPAQHANGPFLKILLAFGAGGLLGDALLHIIPHALSPHDHGHEDAHGHSHGHSHSDSSGHDHSQQLRVGLYVIAGILVFMLVEQLVRIIKRSLVVPYAKILKSPAFLAQLLCQFVINSIVTLLQIYLPLYFKDVLHLSVIANGTYTSVPNVVNFALKIIWGITIDKAKERKYVSGTFAVKLSQSIANFGGALFLILIANFVDCTNPSTGFLFFCLMYGCMGTLVSGFYTSLLSLAPKYTATMSSISVFCAMLGRLLTPAVVGLIKKDDTLAEWQTLFLCCAAANLICGTVFLVFGSGELQEWGLEDPSDEPRPLEMEKTPLQSIQNIPESEDGDVFQSALDMEIPEIQINEITLTTEERERFKRRIREDSMCL